MMLCLSYGAESMIWAVNYGKWYLFLLPNFFFWIAIELITEKIEVKKN